MAEADRPQQGGDDRELIPLASRIQDMSVNEKIQFALKGDTEARRLLIRDANRQVQLAVLQNGRITDTEVVAIANSRAVHDDLLRHIAANRNWMKLYPVRLALVKNPKTPFAISLKLVPTLTMNDLKLLGKSKAIPPAGALAARKIALRA
jgi:hypothetical protein